MIGLLHLCHAYRWSWADVMAMPPEVIQEAGDVLREINRARGGR